MSDVLFQIGAVKLGLSLVLALLAWSAQRLWNRPQLTHMLWLLVLATMLTPAIVRFELTVPALAPLASPLMADVLSGEETQGATRGDFLALLTANLHILWLAGSAIVLCWSLVRVWRFNRSLIAAGRPAPPALQHLASQIAERLGLRRVPSIQIADAKVSPLVWWLGGRPRVLIPAALTAELNHEQLRLMLAHELAHVRRGDHIVRWIEWLACVVFWWNPVTWLARRRLRVAEEMCCDSLALSAAGASPRGYARALLAVVDFLTVNPALQPPALAIKAASGGRTNNLERRLRMIISSESHTSGSRRGRALWMFGAALLPLGLLNVNTSAAQMSHGPGQEAQAHRAQHAQVHSGCEGLAAKVHAAVAAGAITEEDAKKHMLACAEMAKSVGVAMEIHMAVQAGTMTHEQARAKLSEHHALLSTTGHQHDAMRQSVAEHHLRQAVEAGTITADEMKKHLAEMSAHTAKVPAARAATEKPAADCESAKVAIGELLAAGKITAEQGIEKLSAACRR